MLERIEIGNFKAFGDIQAIDIKPLTLLFGANSAGKSTILQSLIYLSEAFTSENWDVYSTNQGGQYIDFGGLQNIVHKKDLSRSIHFGFTISGIRIISPVHFKQDEIDFDVREFENWYQKWLDIRRNMRSERISVSDLHSDLIPYYECSFTFRIGIDPLNKRISYFTIDEEKAEIITYDEKKPARKEVNSEGNILDMHHKKKFSYDVRNISPLSRFFLKGLIFGKFSTHNFQQATLDFYYGLDLSQENSEYLKKEIQKTGIDQDVDMFFAFWLDNLENEAYDFVFRVYSNELNDINTLLGIGSNIDGVWYPIENAVYFSDFLASIEHLGYFRPVPDRLVYGSTTRPLGRRDSTAVWQRIVREDSFIMQQINNYLNNPDYLDMGYELFIQKWNSEDDESQKSRSLTTLEVKDLHTDTIVNLRELGHGIIQIIPILAAVVDISRPFISIEQPELHLHPALQSRLADIFSETCSDVNRKRRFHDGPRFQPPYGVIDGKYYFIETHSEHIIKSIQLAVSKSEYLSMDDVSINYIKRDDRLSHSVIRRIRIDETGAFTEPWPDDFFEISGDLSLQRLKNSLKAKN